jgi:uncharacterized protein YfkK (UPF0435 family)
MNSTRRAEEIIYRIQEYEKWLNKINQGLLKQEKLAYAERNFDTCAFLDMEKQICLAMLNELKWYIYE